MAENKASAAEEIAAGYVTTGKALELGTVVLDGKVDTSARVRIPLAMLNRLPPNQPVEQAIRQDRL